jgi:hypothetical protein
VSNQKQKVIIAGQTLDIDSLEDSLIMQNLLLPKGFDGDKADAVRLFLNLRNMVIAELDRHLTHNYKKMQREGAILVEDGEKPVIGVSFKFEFDFSVPTVAAIGKTKMNVGGGFSSEGKAKTHDINQGDLFEDNTSLDPGAMDREAELERLEKEKEEREADEAKARRDEEKKAAAAAAGDNVTSLPGAAGEPVEQPKETKKKVAKKNKTS